MGRGRERTVICAKCGKNVRRDKAVFLEKVVFTNPAERKDVQDETYTRIFSRELAYCPACGRHLRIYEKKKQQMQRERQRRENSEFSHHFNRTEQRSTAPEAAKKTEDTKTIEVEQPKTS
jgi:ribosomal protein S26